MRLLQRGDALREEVTRFELGEREAGCFVWRCAAGDCITVATLEVLRDLVDDVGFALGLQVEQREPRANFAVPVMHARLP